MDKHDYTAIVIRPYSQKQLAALYGVSAFVMRKWLRSLPETIGPQIGYRYSTQQVIIIFSKLGFPNCKP